MLVIRKLSEAMLPKLRPISGDMLVGDDVQLRITRSGFALSYAPLEPARWQSFPPLPGCTAAEAVAQADAAVYAAFQDELLVGNAVVRAMPEGWSELRDLRVDAVCRRKGIARELLASCERFALRRGSGGLRAAVSDDNPGMCQFLEHAGFRLEGLDRRLLSLAPQQRVKPRALRSSALLFYKGLSGEA